MKETRRVGVREKGTSLAMAALIALGGCAEKRDPQIPTSPLPPDKAGEYTRILQAAIDQECVLPPIQFVRLKEQLSKQGVVRDSVYIAPKKKGEAVKIAVSTDALADEQKWAGHFGISVERFRHINEEIRTTTHGYHACSPHEYDNSRPNPPLVRYVDPQPFFSPQERKTYMVTTVVRRRSDYINPGVALEVEVLMNAPGEKPDSRLFEEPGNFETLITHYLTRNNIRTRYGEQSIQAQVYEETTPYIQGQRAVETLANAAHAKPEDILKAKTQNDAKGIFDILNRGFRALGESHDIQINPTNTQEELRKFSLYGLLTNLTTQKAARGADVQETGKRMDEISRYFFGKRYQEISPSEREKVLKITFELFPER